MKLITTAAALAACLCVGSAQAGLIESGSAASPGNGSMFSDPTGVAAPAPTHVNFAGAPATNAFGRGLSDIGTTPATDFTDFSTITDNRGVAISGWTAYRWFYMGGNGAMGFLENGGRLGKANAANDGQAFANGNDWILVSDAIAVAGGLAADTFDISALVGSDTGPDFTLATYLVLDDTTVVPVDTRTISGNPDPDDLSLTSVGATADFSTVRVMFSIDSVAGGRGLIDDVTLDHISSIPEPGTAVLSLLALAGLGFRRR